MTDTVKQNLKNYIKSISKDISSFHLDPNIFADGLMQRTESLSLDERIKLIWNFFASYILASHPERFKLKVFTKPNSALSTLSITYPWVDGRERVFTSFDIKIEDDKQLKSDALSTIKLSLHLNGDNLSKIEKLINTAKVEVLN